MWAQNGNSGRDSKGKANAKTQAQHETEGGEGEEGEETGEGEKEKGQCIQKEVNEKQNGKR